MTRPLAVKAGSILGTLALACALLITPSIPTHADDLVVLDHGHVDMFDVHPGSDEATLDLGLKEDVTGLAVRHRPEDVLLIVKEEALRDLPEGLPGAPRAYFLPQQQDHNLLWPGWDIQALGAQGFESGSFDVSYTGPDGGRIAMLLSKNFGGFESRLADGGYVMNPEGSTILQPFLAHTHVNWIFTAPGTYTLSVVARASKADGSQAQSPAQTYTIRVGNAPNPDPVDPEPTDPEPTDPTDPADPTDPTDPTPTDPTPTDPTPTDPTDPSPTDPVDPTPADPADPATPSPSPSPSATTPVPAPTMPSVLPAPTSSTPTTSAPEPCLATTITRPATADEIRAWQDRTSSPNRATTTLHFNVGPGASGDASQGHFDLGVGISGGQAVALLKDDRQTPATWRNPSQVTFAVGDAAHLVAPDALSFIATPGSDAWMISSVQQSGVPWLGMNSQREEIVSATTGEVTWTLEGVDGPGRVALFHSGGLGAGVGERLFTSVGDSFVLPRNTHAHPNWLFTAAGHYAVTISQAITPTGAAPTTEGVDGAVTTAADGTQVITLTVGRTPSGKECDLPRSTGGLALTGADAANVSALAGVLALAGLAALAIRRRVAQ